MRERLRRTARRTRENPVLRHSLRSLKPRRSFWGVVGVILFFILPELVAYFWGTEITAWAHAHYLTEPDRIPRLNYWMLEKLFQDGPSWLNLGIGVALLAWLGWEWREEKVT
ncbi:hypothetical protein [Nitratifractor sp.]